MKREPIDQFRNELIGLINRHIFENDLCNKDILAVLEVVKFDFVHDMAHEKMDEVEEDSDDV